MGNKFWMMFCAAALLLGALLPAGIQPVQAQDTQPPQKDVRALSGYPPEGPRQDEYGNWYFPEGTPGGIPAVTAPTATGGPDDYGYIWDDGVPLNWVDATAGTDLGFSGNVSVLSDPIPLPFSFKYYENTYSQVYVSSAGYLTFTDSWVNNQSAIPSPGEPNNVIAPLWSPLTYSSTGPTGRAYYKTGGSEPDRYFLAEWYLVSQSGNGLYTFEVLLYENGDIIFQYQEMQSGGNYCTSSGIEDSQGLDGLTYLPYCSYAHGIPANTAVYFTRPGAMARVNVNPLNHGQLTHSNKVGKFNFTVRNTGDLGGDTYDFNVTSVWPVTLYGPGGLTPMTDTDGDTLVDTGVLAQGSAFNIVARVAAPGGLVVGDENTAYITVVSSLNTAKTKMVRIESTVPAPFAQAYRDQNVGEMNLDLNWPIIQNTINASPDASWTWGYEPSVVETADHNFVYVWRDWQSNNSILHYTVMNQYGQVIKPVTDLTQPDTSLSYLDNGDIALAAAPDGRIGITWFNHSEIYVDNQYLANYNIWFAILNPNGTIAYGPVSLTNNSAFLPYGDNFVRTLHPTIAANGDNRFMVSWYQYYQTGGSYLYEIFYTVRSSTGSLLTPIVKMAEGIPGTLQYRYPKVTSLTSNRFLLAYYYYNTSPYRSGTFFRVYNSGGGLSIPETESGILGTQIDAAQLTGGNVLLATNGNSGIYYTVLDGSSLTPLDNYAPLSHPTATDNYQPSVTIDNANHAILTWTDEQTRYLYYTLLSDNGSVVSGPSIYRAALPGDNISNLVSSYNGHGITTISWEPLAGVDALVGFNALQYDVKPGGTATVWLNYANHGITTAANPVLTLTIPAGLTYMGHDDLSCTLVGPLLTCEIPDLDFLAAGKFPVYLQVPPGAPIGTTYTLNAAITSDGPEADTTNNTADAIVFATIQIYLPVILTK